MQTAFWSATFTYVILWHKSICNKLIVLYLDQ